MTNHPRSPRLKFRVGQVVAIRSEKFRFGATHFAIALRYRKYGVTFYGDGKNPCYAEQLLRPLTKKEAGR